MPGEPHGNYPSPAPLPWALAASVSTATALFLPCHRCTFPPKPSCSCHQVICNIKSSQLSEICPAGQTPASCPSHFRGGSQILLLHPIFCLLGSNKARESHLQHHQSPHQGGDRVSSSVPCPQILGGPCLWVLPCCMHI